MKNRSFMTISNSTVSRNSADFGGGLFNCGSLTLRVSLVSGKFCLYERD